MFGIVPFGRRGMGLAEEENFLILTAFDDFSMALLSHSMAAIR